MLIRETNGLAPSLKGVGTNEVWIRDTDLQEKHDGVRSRRLQCTTDDARFSAIAYSEPSKVTSCIHQHLPADRVLAGRPAEMAC